jgi:cell division septum initiation protein DivIVA
MARRNITDYGQFEEMPLAEDRPRRIIRISDFDEPAERTDEQPVITEQGSRRRGDDFTDYEHNFERTDELRSLPVATGSASIASRTEAVQERLHELAVIVEDAKSVPLSASCMVNRAQVLDLIEEIRVVLPAAVREADQLLAERETVIDEGRVQAQRIIERARAEAARMISEHEIYQGAVEEAQALRDQVADEVDRMRAETDDYIDSKLATFEITLNKTLQTVDRARQRLRSMGYEDLAPSDETYPGEGYEDEGRRGRR